MKKVMMIFSLILVATLFSCEKKEECKMCTTIITQISGDDAGLLSGTSEEEICDEAFILNINGSTTHFVLKGIVYSRFTTCN